MVYIWRLWSIGPHASNLPGYSFFINRTGKVASRFFNLSSDAFNSSINSDIWSKRTFRSVSFSSHYKNFFTNMGWSAPFMFIDTFPVCGLHLGIVDWCFLDPCTPHRPNPCNNAGTIVASWSQFRPPPPFGLNWTTLQSRDPTVKKSQTPEPPTSFKQYKVYFVNNFSHNRGHSCRKCLVVNIQYESCRLFQG